MVSPREIFRGSMSAEKAASDKMNPLVYYIGRPIACAVASPLIAMGVKATQVTIFSLFAILLALPVMSFTHGILWHVFGGMLWGLWAICDYIDGSIARYTNTRSEMGGLWDAVGGYVAMWVWPISAGMAAYFESANALIKLSVDPALYIFVGGIASICAIFPRLVMHKAYHDHNSSGDEFRKKNSFSQAKQLALILTDPIGVPIYLYFVACFTNTYNLFILGYTLLLILFCIASCISVFKNIAKDCKL